MCGGGAHAQNLLHGPLHGWSCCLPLRLRRRNNPTVRPASEAEPPTVMATPKTTVYTFGCPKPGNDAFRSVYDALVPETFRLVAMCDLVSAVPPGSGYAHVGREVWLDDAGGQTFAMSWAMQEILPARNSLSYHWLANYYKRLNKAFVEKYGQSFRSVWSHLPGMD